MSRDDFDYAEDARKLLISDECAMSRWLQTDNLSELRLFLETMENFIEGEEQRAVQSLRPHASDPDFWVHHYPYQWQDIIGSQLRQSFVVSLMSATEFHLEMLCRDAGMIVQSPINHIDLRGPALPRARKFLQSFAHFVAPSEALWESVGDLQVLRNCIVHNGAIVDAERNGRRITAMMRRIPGISNPFAGVLELKREFCSNAHKVVETFFDELHAQQVLLCKHAANNMVA